MTLRIESTPRILIGLGIAVLVFVALWKGGWRDLAIEDLVVKGIASAVVILLLPVVVIFHGTQYPSQRHKQSTFKIDALKADLASRSARQADIDLLSRNHADAFQWVFKNITQGEYEAWKVTAQAWADQVVGVLGARFSEAEQRSFANATPTGALLYNNRISDEHNGVMRKIVAMNERLQLIIDQRQAALLNQATLP